MNLEGLDTINIKKIREYTDTPFEQLAEILGVTVEEYIRIEAEEVTMTVDQFITLKKFYNVPAEYLMARLFAGITVTRGLYAFLRGLENSGLLNELDGYDKLSNILLRDIVITEDNKTNDQNNRKGLLDHGELFRLHV